jgi:hypothetical protein
LTPLEVLAHAPERITRLIAGVPLERMGKRPAPGTLSVTEILAHLADAEFVQGFRIRLILGASGTSIQGFDQDAWATCADYASHNPTLSFEAYRVTRERTTLLLKDLTEEMWKRFGMHSERGKETVRRVSEMMVGHDINHIRQIEAILNGRKGRAINALQDPILPSRSPRIHSAKSAKVSGEGSTCCSSDARHHRSVLSRPPSRRAGCPGSPGRIVCGRTIDVN